MGLFDFLNSNVVKINGVEFPKFSGKVKYRETRNKPNYKRKNFYYKKEDVFLIQEYIPKINSYGFEKKTDVRYENNNGDYIIIDPNYTDNWKGSKLHIAFQAKK